MSPLRLAFTLSCLAAVPLSAAHASVDTSPPPGGVFRLKPGIFVPSEKTCERAVQGDLLVYDGKALRPPAQKCRTVVISRKSQTFVADRACGNAKPVRQTVAVDNALAFTFTMGRRSVAYGYCATYQLAPGLRAIR